MSNTFVDKIFKDTFATSDAVFLLFIIIAGHYVTETLGCQLRSLFGSSMVVRHFILFCMIYFSTEISADDDITQHPAKKLLTTIIVFVAFVMFNKMDFVPTMICLILMAILFLSIQYKQYYNNLKDDESTSQTEVVALDSSIQQISLLQKIGLTLLVVIVIIGNVFYFIRQKKHFAASFSMKKYIFGVQNCCSQKCTH